MKRATTSTVSAVAICITLFLALVASSSHAATITWTNTAGGNWNTAANWSPNQVPTAADTALITNTGTYTVTVSANATAGGLTLSDATAGTRRLQITGGTLTATNTAVAANGVIEITGGTLLTGGTFDCAGIVNETSGSWRLLTPGNVNVYNYTNGELRGANMTVTNFTWVAGHLYADAPGDKTIIPPGGTFNLVSDNNRVLSYYAGGFGRGIDNRGTWNWYGNCVLTAYPCDVNNYGTLNFLNQGVPSSYAQFGNQISTLPNFNNFGTINKSVGTNIVYFGPCNLSNSGGINLQGATGALYHGTTTNTGTMTVQSATLLAVNSTVHMGGTVNLSTDSIFQTDSGTIHVVPSGSLTVPGTNAFRINGGTVNLYSTNITAPSAWIAGGTLFHQTNNTIPVINESSGTWRMTGNQTVSVYNQTNGELRGGTLTITNCNWYNGHWYADAPGDKTIIPVGGVLNFLTPASRVLSYYAGGFGRNIDNRGTWNWADNSILTAYPCDVNNYGTINFLNQGTPVTYAQFGNQTATLPNLNNFGTITKNVGTNIVYFGPCNLNNASQINFQGGTAILYTGTTTNSGQINITNGSLLAQSSTVGVSGQVNISSNSIFQTDSGTVTFYPTSLLSCPGYNAFRIPGGTVNIQSANISAPSAWISGGTLFHQSPNTIPVINEGSGTWRLAGAHTVSAYNLTNGELRGGTLTVTNLNWYNGNLNADVAGDKTIIPAGGVMNMMSTAARYFSYYTGGEGRYLDNYGTWNWTDNSVLSAYPCVVNNYGAVNITSTGAPGTYSQFSYVSPAALPVWNNFGTVTKSIGTNIFYFGACRLNNSGTLNCQSGTLSLYASTVTNLASGVITVGPGAELVNENSSSTTLQPGSLLNGVAPNAFRIASGNVYVRSTDLSLPSMWLAGGVVYQLTNSVVPMNQSGGTWQLGVPVTATTYNLTNGELRGANLTVNNFNWFGGQMNSDGPGNDLVTVNNSLNISGNTAKTLSYWVAPGRSLINNGSGSWGGVGITGQGASTLRNNGTLTVTNDVALVWGGSGAGTVLHNTGTFTKSGGTGQSYFSSTTITNSGTFNYQSGQIRFASFTQTGGTASLNTNFVSDGALRVQAGTFSGGGSVAGELFNNSALSPGASPGLIAGSTFTSTGTGSLNIELGGSTAAGTNYDQLRLSGAATLAGTLNVTLANNFAPSLSNSFTVMTFGSRSGTFPTFVPPPGVVLNAAYTSTNLVLTVLALTNVPLQITSFPSNSTVFQGDPATFFVGVSGTTPITYQWQFNSNNIVGATNATYTIPATVLTNAGTYSVFITDATAATTNTSATLAIIPFNGTIQWTNTLGGNWFVPANWFPNRVPGPTNTAAITAAGTYTVSIGSSAAVGNLVVGGNSGTQTVNLASSQTLALGTNSAFATNTILGLDGTLQTAGGSNYFGGLVNWYSGVLSGPGRSVVGTNGNLFFISGLVQKHVVSNILENRGQFTYSGDSGFGPGQLLQFSGGAQLTNHPSGVINMSANALQYAGAQTPRSYLFNYGKIVTASPGVFSPSYISIEFINHGKLENYGYVYISRGTNYGEFWGHNGLAEISIFGDPNTGEYFSFEPGTTLTGVGPNIACGGPVQWRAGAGVHAGSLRIFGGSGGASFPNAEFKVLANYTNTATLAISRGLLTIPNPATITDLRSYSDGFVSFWSFGVTNAGTMYVDNLSHVIYNIGNGGSMIVRSNANFAGGSLSGSGNVIVRPGATTTFSGGSVDAQLIQNFGAVTVSAATHYTGGGYLENKLGANVYFGGGDFRTGPASLANFGTMNGFGGIYIPATNHNIVSADDSLNRYLNLGDYWQTAGETRLRGGHFSGPMTLLGGTLNGAGNVGSVVNGAGVLPGLPIGIINTAGGYTNLTSGVYHMQIAGTNNYDRLNVAGNAQLSGTLSLTLTNGFFPFVGSTYTAMTYTARSGAFANVLMPGYQFEVIYLTNALILRASNALPVVNFSVTLSEQYVCNPVGLMASAGDLDGIVTNMSFYLDGSLLKSTPGSGADTTVEIDYPLTGILTARATDDRGAFSTATQTVNWVTMPLHMLMLGGMRTNNHNFKICMVGSNSANYMVLVNTNLITTNWAPIGLMSNFTNNMWRFFDPNATNQQRYYRAQKQ